MRPSQRKIFSDFTGNLSRSALVVAAISVGLFAIGVIMIVYVCLQYDLTKGFEATNPANIYLMTSPFDRSLIERVSADPDVRDVNGGRTHTFQTAAADGSQVKLQLQAVHRDEWSVNRLELMEGRLPTEKGEIALERYKFDQYAKTLGDRVTVILGSGKKVDLTVTGIYRDQNVGADSYSQIFLSSGSGIVSEKALRGLELPESWDLLKIVVNGDGNDRAYLDAVAEKIANQIEKAGHRIDARTISFASAHPIGDYTDAIVQILFIIGVLIIFLSGSLTYNTLSAILSQQVDQIGAMKTIGAGTRQIIALYMRLIFIYSVISLVIAIPLSMVVGELIRNYLADFLNYRLIRTGIVWEAIAVQIFLGLIVPQVSGVIPVISGARIRIREAISGEIRHQRKTPRARKNGQDDRLSGNFLLKRVPRPISLSLRNTFKNPTRLVITLLTLSLGGAIVIATLNLNEMLDRQVDSMSNYYRGDISVVMNEPYRVDQVAAELMGDARVDFIEGWGSGSATLVHQDGSDGPEIIINAPQDDTRLSSAKLKAGRWYEPGERDVIVLSERFQFIYPDLQIGDALRMKMYGQEKEIELKIIGFFSLTGKTGGFITFMPLTTYREIAGLGARVTRFEIRLNEKMDETLLKTVVCHDIEQRLDGNGFDVNAVSLNNAFVKDASGGLTTLKAFLFIMAILVAAVGCIGLAGTMSLNVIDQTREIGILRSIGASDRAVMLNVMLEGQLIGLMSWFVGVVLSFPVMRFLGDAIGNAVFGSPLDFAYTWISYALWLAVSMLISYISCLLPAKNATRLTIQEVLMSE